MEAVKEFVTGTVPSKTREALSKLDALKSAAMDTNLTPDGVKRVIVKFRSYFDKFE